MRRLTRALAVLGVLWVTSTAHGAIPGPAIDPTLQLPVDGAPRVGQPISVATGVWSGAPDTLDATWERCNVMTLQCVAVGAGPRYVPVAADAGSRLRAVVTATNGDGHASIATAPSGVVPSSLVTMPVEAIQRTVIPDRRVVRGTFGGHAVVTGRLTGSTGAIPGAGVAAVDPMGRVRGRATTGQSGRFRLRIPLRSAGGWHLVSGPASVRVTVSIRPRIQLTRATRAVRAPGVVGLRGRMQPAVRGKAVQLQYLAPGRGWRVWRQVKTGPRGRFSVHRVLAANPAVPRFTLRIRAAVAQDVGWPYPSTATRSVGVRVR